MLNKIETIIEEQIKKFYGDVFKTSCSEKLIIKDKQRTSNYIIIHGNESLPKELNKEEQLKWILMQKHISFSYINNMIIITVDEHWTNEELNDFLNKTINQKDIIEAINSKLIQLKINGIHVRHHFTSNDLTTKDHKEWRNKQNNFIRTLENTLKKDGILEFNLDALK